MSKANESILIFFYSNALKFGRLQHSDGVWCINYQTSSEIIQIIFKINFQINRCQD